MHSYIEAVLHQRSLALYNISMGIQLCFMTESSKNVQLWGQVYCLPKSKFIDHQKVYVLVSMCNEI